MAAAAAAGKGGYNTAGAFSDASARGLMNVAARTLGIMAVRFFFSLSLISILLCVYSYILSKFDICTRATRRSATTFARL